MDEEYASLLHRVYSKNISAHFSRSFFITPTPGPWREKDVYVSRAHVIAAVVHNNAFIA